MDSCKLVTYVAASDPLNKTLPLEYLFGLNYVFHCKHLQIFTSLVNRGSLFGERFN